MDLVAASPRHTASPPSPPPAPIDPNATPAALAKLLADQLHEVEALRTALATERARADTAERQLAALQGPPAAAIAEYEERLRQAEQARATADRARDAAERAREDAEARVRGVADHWSQLNAYLRMAEIRANDARAGFDRVVAAGGVPLPAPHAAQSEASSTLVPGARRARSPSMDAGAYPPAKRARPDAHHRARSRSTSPSVEELIIEASGEEPAASQIPRRATYPPAYPDAARPYPADASHSPHAVHSQVVHLAPSSSSHGAYPAQPPPPPPPTGQAAYPRPPSHGAPPFVAPSAQPMPRPSRPPRERPVPNPQRGIGTVKHHYQSRPFAPKVSGPFVGKGDRGRNRDADAAARGRGDRTPSRVREGEDARRVSALRVSPSDEDAAGSPDSTFNAVAANEVALEESTGNESATAPTYPKTNAEGQRICRQCGQPGRYKDGKCVEKWGPGPMGPGTVCDRCRKKMKRVERRGTVGATPNPMGGTLIDLSAPHLGTSRALQHARTMPAYPDDRRSPYGSDRRPEYSPGRFEGRARYAGEDRAEDRGRYVADDRFEDRPQYASGSRDHAGEDRSRGGAVRGAGGEGARDAGSDQVRYANGNEGPRYRDFVKEARYGRSAAYAPAEPRYGDPRFGAYDSLSDVRPQYPAGVSQARYSASQNGLPALNTYPPAGGARYASADSFGYASDHRGDANSADPRYASTDAHHAGGHPHLHSGVSPNQRPAVADAPPSPSPRMVSSPASAFRVIVESPVSEDADGEAEEDELMADEATQKDLDVARWAGQSRVPHMMESMESHEGALPARLSPRRGTPSKHSSRTMSPARPVPPEDDVDADIAAALDGPPADVRSTHDDDIDADIAAAVDAPSEVGPRSRHTSEARSRHDDVDDDIAAAVDDADADADLHDAADAARAAIGSRSGSRVAYSDTPSRSSVDAEGEVDDSRRSLHAPSRTGYPHPGPDAAADTTYAARGPRGDAEDEDDELLAAVDAAEAGERP
ncbi:hypothetical protein HDZ31DRAFT_72627 [Schizophyllum fasciatum]